MLFIAARSPNHAHPEGNNSGAGAQYLSFAPLHVGGATGSGFGRCWGAARHGEAEFAAAEFKQGLRAAGKAPIRAHQCATFCRSFQ